MKAFADIFRSSALLLFLMCLLLGLAYPLLVTGIAQMVFPHQANGSLIVRGGEVVGSELIGQQVENEWYFWGRPSAAQPAYNAALSGGSNLGPANELLLARILERTKKLQSAPPYTTKAVPIDLVTASGSGLDPHISLAAARYQVPRVAAARHISRKKLYELIERHTESFAYGLFGMSYVNVIKLNLALDESIHPFRKK